MATDNPPNAKTADGDLVSIELPAPTGWKKKFTPRKGGTPGRNEIVFIAPDGEEIRSKKQLRLYLESHSTGVTVKEFDWSTGDTPRRSARLSEKSKASESPDNDTAKKRQRKSSSKEAVREKNDAGEDEGTAEDAKEITEVSNAEDAGEHDDRDVVSKEALPQKDDMRRAAVGGPGAEEQKAADTSLSSSAAHERKADTKEEVAAAEEPEASAEEHKADSEEQKAADDDKDVQLGTNEEDADVNKDENRVSDGKPPNREEEDFANTSLPSAAAEEAESVPTGAKVALNMTTFPEAANTDMVLDAVEDLPSSEADATAVQYADKVVLVDQLEYTSNLTKQTADVVEAHKDSWEK